MGPSIPEDVKKYCVFDKSILGEALLDSAPKKIRDKAIEWEKYFYSITGRRTIKNLEIDEESIPCRYYDLIDHSFDK